MRTTQIAYDASDNIQYWGKELATGDYEINRYYYDGSGNLTTIKEGRQGAWADRESLDWS